MLWYEKHMVNFDVVKWQNACFIKVKVKNLTSLISLINYEKLVNAKFRPSIWQRIFLTSRHNLWHVNIDKNWKENGIFQQNNLEMKRVIRKSCQLAKKSQLHYIYERWQLLCWTYKKYCLYNSVLKTKRSLTFSILSLSGNKNGKWEVNSAFGDVGRSC